MILWKEKCDEAPENGNKISIFKKKSIFAMGFTSFYYSVNTEFHKRLLFVLFGMVTKSGGLVENESLN